ncbi:exonuclease domain-containing protein [Floccifex sp.]|uniref:exonuclease domain-containing protein n=1 Tax=Floccifex sp. TaxID=2815810 RepID=UPI003F05D230
MEREYKGNSLLEYVKDYVVIDIETTGFSPINDKIIEIGAIKVKNNQVIDEFNCLLSIDERISNSVEKLTGITNQMIQEQGIDEKEAIVDFDNFIEDYILIGHNVNFDINFLYDYFEQFLNKPLTNNFIDTQRLAKKIIKDSSNYKLTTLAKRFHIENKNAHRALNDVYVTNELYQQLHYYSEHYVEERLKEINLKHDEEFSNEKIAFKTKMKYLDNELIEELLKKLNTKSYFTLSQYAHILIVNDKTYEKLLIPLDRDDEYMWMFNAWMFRAQERMEQGTLKLISETEFCQRLGILVSTNRQVNEQNQLYGKTCVFTGTLEKMTRSQAEKIVLSIGGFTGSSVTRKTDYLILGYNSHKSTKHKRAEQLQQNGQDIQIISEDMFYKIIE